MKNISHGKITLVFLAMAFLVRPDIVHAQTNRSQTIIYTDNFAVPNTTVFDTSSQTGRHTGQLASKVVPQSGGIELQIVNNWLLLPGNPNNYADARMRFDPSTNYTSSYRWDWSSGTAGSAMAGSGGMVVTFNWVPADTSDNWISFCTGILPNSDMALRVIASTTDSGILLRNSGGYQVYKLGSLVASGNAGSFPVLGTNAVALYYYFNSWAPGSAVTLSACVNGKLIATQNFTWTQSGGVQNMELGSYATGTLVNNFGVTALTPPAISIKGTAGACQWANLVNAGWTYNWGTFAPGNLAPGVVFYPMWWSYYGGSQASDSQGMKQMVLTNAAPALLMYNEPDHADQANLTTAYALQGYTQASIAARTIGFNNLISPACADDGDSWMQQFMAAVGANNLLCRAVAIHCYNSTASSFLSYVDGIHNNYGYNVYITEFAPTDWQSPTSITVANCQSFMATAIPGLKSRSYVLGYSWYCGTFPGTNVLQTAALFTTNGVLTTLGSQYKGY